MVYFSRPQCLDRPGDGALVPRESGPPAGPGSSAAGTRSSGRLVSGRQGARPRPLRGWLDLNRRRASGEDHLRRARGSSCSRVALSGGGESVTVVSECSGDTRGGVLCTVAGRQRAVSAHGSAA